jgi:hypothetical protein
MSERPTPETDDQPIIYAINDNGYQVPCVDIEFARRLERERDELREALKKCREDSVCYAEHMRRCGYSEAYKKSNENADRATRILKEAK